MVAKALMIAPYMRCTHSISACKRFFTIITAITAQSDDSSSMPRQQSVLQRG